MLGFRTKRIVGMEDICCIGASFTGPEVVVVLAVKTKVVVDISMPGLKRAIVGQAVSVDWVVRAAFWRIWPESDLAVEWVVITD